MSTPIEERIQEETKQEIKKISDALFGKGEEEGIVEWARNHIESEKERREIYKELRKRLAVSGVMGALGILGTLLWFGLQHYIERGG